MNDRQISKMKKIVQTYEELVRHINNCRKVAATIGEIKGGGINVTWESYGGTCIRDRGCQLKIRAAICEQVRIDQVELAKLQYKPKEDKNDIGFG